MHFCLGDFTYFAPLCFIFKIYPDPGLGYVLSVYPDFFKNRKIENFIGNTKLLLLFLA